MPAVSDYLARLPSFNAGQPAFTSTLAVLLQPLASLQNFLGGVPAQFDLDTAVGVQLDQVGLWIGRDRFVQTPITGVYFSWDTDGLGWEEGYWQGAFDPDDGISSLDDGTYRALLYAKAAANVWDSSPAAINIILNKLLANENVTATVVDNQDMSMQVTINGTLTSLIFQAILTGGYLPIKPAGVSINYLIPNTNPTLSSGTQVVGQGSVTAHAAVRQHAQATIAGAGAVAALATGGTGVGNFTVSSTIGVQGSVTAVVGVISGGFSGSPWSSGFSTGFGPLGGLTSNPWSSGFSAAFGPISAGGGSQSSINIAGSVIASAQGGKFGTSRVSGVGSVTANATVQSGSSEQFVVTSQPHLVLSNGNRTVTAASGITSGVWEPAVGTVAHTSGKFYFEFHFDANANLNNAVGFVDDTFDPTQYNDSLGGPGTVQLFSDGSQTVINTPSTSIFNMLPYTTGNVLAIALDLGNGVFWVNLNNAGWFGSANGIDVTSGNPTSNTNGIAHGLHTAGGIKPAVAMADAAVAITAHFSSSTWTFAAPTGYGAL